MPSPKLPVLGPDPVQDCVNCPQISKCWNLVHGPTDAVLALNLLVCRLKLGIDPQRTCKTLLRLLRPKVIQLYEQIRDRVTPRRIDSVECIADIESAIVENLLVKYRMGERSWPTTYLFGHRGVMRGWVQTYARKYRRNMDELLSTHYDDSYDGARTTAFERHSEHATRRALEVNSHHADQTFEDRAIDRLDVATNREPLLKARIVINDGLTLSSSEYRVLQFCLQNANESEVLMINGLHAHLARTTGVKRKTISRRYGTACRKLLDGLGLRNQRLQDIGIETRSDGPLTPEEIHSLLHLAAAQQNSLSNLCWAYGIGSRSFYRLRTTFGGKSLQEIKDEYKPKS